MPGIVFEIPRKERKSHICFISFCDREYVTETLLMKMMLFDRCFQTVPKYTTNTSSQSGSRHSDTAMIARTYSQATNKIKLVLSCSDTSLVCQSMA